MAIHVVSFDFDDCLAHKKYYQQNRDVITANRGLLDGIRIENSKYCKTISFVGSNRQSYLFELANLVLLRGPCFTDMLKLSKYLDATFDPFLLADVYSDLEDGTSFKSSLSDNFFYRKDKGWVWDRQKATLLYAQIQKVANENPTEAIIFDFYDDRGNNLYKEEHTLERLNNFFEKNSQLIPKNVTLNLHHYAGEHTECLFQIKGSGGNNPTFKQTVKDMAKQAKEKDWARWFFSGQISAALYVNSEELSIDQVHQDVIDDAQESSQKAEELVVTQIDFDVKKALANLEAQLIIIKYKVDSLEKSGNKLKAEGESQKGESYLVAARAGKDLCNEVKGNVRKLLSGEISKDKYQSNYLDIRNKYCHILEHHRGWKQILGNLALAIVGLGFCYVVAGVVNKTRTGHFLFFKTDTANKINGLEKANQKMLDSISESSLAL